MTQHMQELALIKRLRRIRSELGQLGATKTLDPAPFDESLKVSAAITPTDDYMLSLDVRKGLKVSMQRELDDIQSMKQDIESRKNALFAAISDAEQRLTESTKGRRRQNLQDRLLQLRSKTCSMNFEAEACESMQKQLQLACRSRYLRTQKLYKDIESIDEQSALLISSRWIHSSVPTPPSAADREINGTGQKGLERLLETKKTPLATSIEQCLAAAIAATTPRSYRPNDPFDFTHTA
jgi:hypothetical protein